MLKTHTEHFFSESKKFPAADNGIEFFDKGGLFVLQDARARADMYGFLAAAYLRPPTWELVRCLLAEEFIEEISSLFDEAIVENLKQITDIARVEADFASIGQEYMNLFAVPTGRYVTPYEDVYQGITIECTLKRGPLLGERAIAARRIYREAGADMRIACKELPTHIGVELSFMSFLCEQEAEAIYDEDRQKLLNAEEIPDVESERYRRLQIKFLKEHLNVWFPRLNLSIQKNARSPFYKILALITEAFLAYDTSTLFVNPV